MFRQYFFSKGVAAPFSSSCCMQVMPLANMFSKGFLEAIVKNGSISQEMQPAIIYISHLIDKNRKRPDLAT